MFRNGTSFSSVIFILAAAVGVAHADSFNVNLAVLTDPTTTLEAGDSPAGFNNTPAEDWQNIGSGNGTTALLSVNGAGASFTLNRQRNSGRTHGGSRTNNLNDGNATLLDVHLNGTANDGAGPNNSILYFGERIVDFEITDIPFTQYDVVVYFGYNEGQYTGSARFADTGLINIRINDDVVPLATLDANAPDPNVFDWAVDGEAYKAFLETRPGEFEFFMPHISDGAADTIDSTIDLVGGSDTEGNYIIYEGLTSSTFKAQVWGEYFMHGGPTGFQIIEAVPEVVPEPASVALLMIMGTGVIAARRRR